MPAPISILLTVPHLNRTASPYRETLALARYLPGPDFRVTVCSLREKGFPETAPALEGMGVDAFVAPFRPTGFSPAHLWQFRKAQNAVGRSGAYAIQHSLDFTSLPIEAAVARTRSRIYIYSQRNLNENGHEMALRLKARLARRIICISAATENLLLGLGVPSAKLRRIPLGIDLEEFAALPPPEPEPGRFLFVGQFARRKRHDDAIRALALVARDHASARLAMVGNLYDEGYREELRRLAGELGVADRIEFLGIRADVPRLMRRAQAVVLCSESEAFGWVVLEAMAAGVPVIASAVDGPREILEHNRTGLLVPCRDVAGYAAAMRMVLEHPAAARALARNARAAVEQRYSAAAMVERLKSVYREVFALAEFARHPTARPCCSAP